MKGTRILATHPGAPPCSPCSSGKRGRFAKIEPGSNSEPEEGAMELDLDRVRTNVRSATTEDLLDRATVYRAGMEPEALDIIEAELEARNVTTAEIRDHEERRRRVMNRLPDGTA